MKKILIISLCIGIMGFSSCFFNPGDSDDNKGDNSEPAQGTISVPLLANDTDIIIAGKIVPAKLEFKGDAGETTTAPSMQMDQYTIGCTIFSMPVRYVSGTISTEGDFAFLLSEAKDVPFSCYMLDLNKAFSGILYYEDSSWVGSGGDKRQQSQLRLSYNTYIGSVEYDSEKNLGRINKSGLKGLTVYADGSADVLAVGGTEYPADNQQPNFDFTGTWALWDMRQADNYPGTIAASLQLAEDIPYYGNMKLDATNRDDNNLPNGLSIYYVSFRAQEEKTGYIISALQAWIDQASFLSCGGRIGADMTGYVKLLDDNVANGEHLWTSTYVDPNNGLFNGWRMLSAVDPDSGSNLPCSFYSGLDQYQCFADYYNSNHNGFSRNDSSLCVKNVHFDWTATDPVSFVKTDNDIPKAVNEVMLEEIIFTAPDSGSLVSYNEKSYGFNSPESYTCTVRGVIVSNFVVVDTDGIANNEAIGDMLYIKELAADSHANCSKTDSPYEQNKQMEITSKRYLLYYKKQ